MDFCRITEKTKLTVEKTEMKMKVLDKKIEILKHELYENASSMKILKKQNIKLSGFMAKVDSVHTDSYFYPDIFSYFKSLQDVLNQNTYFTEIIDALKNEVYKKPDVTQDEDALFSSITLPEKTLYSQWILQTLIKKLSKIDDERCDFDTSLETLSYLKQITVGSSISISDVYPATLSILNNMSFKILSDNEQDLLIFMHLTARLQSIFELVKAVDFKHDSSQLLSSKVKRYEIQKRYLKLLYKLKHLLDSMGNIDLSNVFHAITKSKGIHRSTEDFSEAFETMKYYIIHASGQMNGILGNLQFDKDRNMLSSVDNVYHELSFKVQQCIDQGSEKFSKVLPMIGRSQLIFEHIKDTMFSLRILEEMEFNKEFSAMRYLCELHCIKEQILTSFEILLDSMLKLCIDEEDDQIINRLIQFKIAADSLTRKYETIGMQLMLFSDVMAIMNREKLEVFESGKSSNEETVMNISKLFGPTEKLKKLHGTLDAATRYKWFPAKTHLSDMLKDKERTIQAFQNFLDRLPELDIHNTLDIMHSVRQLIMNGENILRRFQSLRMQLIWIAGDYVFNVKNI